MNLFLFWIFLYIWKMQGPQYVCTNFWTFICTTCSGIQWVFSSAFLVFFVLVIVFLWLFFLKKLSKVCDCLDLKQCLVVGVKLPFIFDWNRHLCMGCVLLIFLFWYIYVHVIQSRVYSSSEVSIHVEVHIPRSWSSSKWWQSGIGGGEFLLALGTVGFFYCYVDQTLKCFQRAREIYLKDWNQQRQRLPDNRCNIFSVVLLLCL
jgi:hypothetical protein